MGAVSAILVAGREVACDAVVRAHNSMRFSALARRTETRAVLLHWTGGRGLAPQVFRTLQERGLSVHFCVEPDGTVWQYADAALRCAHAGVANSWSAGLEIVNPATPAAAPGRALESDVIHGHRIHYAGFTELQTAAALAVTRSLCGAFGLPYVARAGHDLMSNEEMLSFRGVLGHYEVSSAKRDPGRRILERVNAS